MNPVAKKTFRRLSISIAALSIISISFNALAGDCQARASATAYEIDDDTGYAEYTVVIQPNNCQKGCSGRVEVEAKYAVTRQTQNPALDHNNKFSMRTENETNKNSFRGFLSWKSRSGESIEINQVERTATFSCRKAMGNACQALGIKIVESYCNNR